MSRYCGTHHGTRQWINNEPCGLFCGSITYFLILYGMYATTLGVIIPWLGFSLLGLLNILIFNGLSILTMYTHFKTMTTDPGAVPKDARPLSTDTEELDFEGNDRDRYKKFCRKCSAFKPVRAHHCSICGRCVIKMDHHCPWVNNCVGVGNHKLFLLFCFYVFVTCSYSLLLTASRFLICIYYSDCRESPIPELFLVFLVIEGILFGLFTLCMIGDQMTVIITNQTQIDRLKNKKYDIQTEIHEVFGTPSQASFLWSWFIPAPTIFPHHVRDIILGFQLINNEHGAGEEEKQSLLGKQLTSNSNGKNTHQDISNSSEEDKLAESLFANSSSSALRPRSKRKAMGETVSEDSSYTGEENGQLPESNSNGDLSLPGPLMNGGNNGTQSLNSGNGNINGVINGVNGAVSIEMTVPVTSAVDYGGNVRKRM